MRCTNCDYILWNLPSRTCPECDTPFDVSSYYFPPNKVAFCCPHCHHEHTSPHEHGRPDPPTFNCQRCTREISLNNVIVKPLEEHAEASTTQNINAWTRRKEIGWFVAFHDTLARGILAPRQLIKSTPTHHMARHAIRFAAAQLMIPLVIVLIYLALGGVIILYQSNLTSPSIISDIRFFGFVVVTMLQFVAMLALMLAGHCSLTHYLITATSRKHACFDETCAAILYTFPIISVTFLTFCCPVCIYAFACFVMQSPLAILLWYITSSMALTTIHQASRLCVMFANGLSMALCVTCFYGLEFFLLLPLFSKL